MTITRVRGTQDILDFRPWAEVIAQFERHAALYHFIPIATPILEPVALFKRSLGTHTDVVSKEMFLIDASRSEEEICLRPEATASAVRAFLEAHIERLPWCVYTWGPMFRYERPQKGRYRQFHQISLEMIGAHNISHDVTMIMLLERFFHEVMKLDTYTLQLNFLGCAADRQRYKELLGKFLDVSFDAICTQCKERRHSNILRVLDCKNLECQALYKKAPIITESLCDACGSEWEQLQAQLLLLSISYVLNPHLVRGLDYYNKTVFEFSSANLGAQSAFCGGGRYELASLLGGAEQPSVGAAFGIERLMLLREAQGIEHTYQPSLIAVCPLTPEEIPLAQLVADELRAKGLIVELVLDRDSVKSIMRYVNKLAAKYAVLIGPDERASRSAQVKNMITSAQETISQGKLVEYFNK